MIEVDEIIDTLGLAADGDAVDERLKGTIDPAVARERADDGDEENNEEDVLVPGLLNRNVSRDRSC